jgi:transcriptional regulator with XRE-family HTH domain
MARTPNFSLVAPEVSAKALALGARIRAARQARRLRLEDVAAKAGISRSTVEAVEQGSLSSSLGAYLAVLGCMNLADELDLIADPGLDREGLAYSVSEKRVRLPGKLNNDF